MSYCVYANAAPCLDGVPQEWLVTRHAECLELGAESHADRHFKSINPRSLGKLVLTSMWYEIYGLNSTDHFLVKDADNTLRPEC